MPRRDSMKPTISAIVAAVEAEYGLPKGVLYYHTQEPWICFPRQVAWWLIRDLQASHRPASYPAIARLFSGKHHTTVLHGVQKIEQQQLGDEELQEHIARIKLALGIHTTSTRNVLAGIDSPNA